MNTAQGLNNEEAKQRLAIYGPNEISEQRHTMLRSLWRALGAPASLMLFVASALSFFIGRSFDGNLILFLLALNVGIGIWHEHKADRALALLRAQFTVSARVLRDGAWRAVASRLLVPGDFVECSVGTLVPADLRIDDVNNAQLNEAVLTGESLPKEKKEGDTAYSGSVVATGLIRGTVIATGSRAYFGKIAVSATGAKRRSRMEQDILSISRFLIIASISAAVILTLFFLYHGRAPADTLLLDVSLLIAGIPISLPTVMTLIVSLGAVSLARQHALVRRLAALEDLANVTLLLTDKTGTLTENKITAERVHTYGVYAEDMMLRLSAFAASGDSVSQIDAAIAEKGKEAMAGHRAEVLAFTPADSVRKRKTTLFSLEGKRYLVSLGSPPTLAAFAAVAEGDAARYARDRADAARAGARGVAAACKENPTGVADEKNMALIGLFVLSDPLRRDATKTINFIKKEGIRTIIVTGDTTETAAHIASSLHMAGKTVRAADATRAPFSRASLDDVAAFAEVVPADKLALVVQAQRSFTVAVAGDGVNDLPALRRADVGMAVANAVDALKATADVVFLEPGIGVMRTALIESRKIFLRLYYYSIYRISESFRLVVTALALGLIIRDFPLTPVQIILLAFLNDIPIITLAFDRVKRSIRPADIRPRERFVLGMLYGLVGVANSILFYFLLASVWRVPLAIIQTAFFLKLTVSGHLLIYVAHTSERWWRFLPAKSVIGATVLTQLCATALALFGFFITPISLALAAFIWLWSFLWMQVSEGMKMLAAQ